MPIALTALDVPFSDDYIKLIHFAWSDEEKTTIRITSKKTKRIALVEFDSVEGLRMLSELDLASFWLGADKEKLQSSWLFKVLARGWLEQEAQRDDLYMKHEPRAPQEFLIAGYGECISILSFAVPKVYELPTPPAI
jgi:hypothetical protein